MDQDEKNTDVVGQEPQPEAPQPEGQAPEPAEGDALDAIALQNEIKKLRRENAKWRTQLRGLEEQEQERQRAEMSELDRIKADLADLQAQYEQKQQEWSEAHLRREIVAAASRANMHDPDDAWRHIDMAVLEQDEEGRLSNLDEALVSLIKTKPYLFKGKQLSIAPTQPSGQPQPTSDELLRQEMFGHAGGGFWKGGGVSEQEQ